MAIGTSNGDFFPDDRAYMQYLMGDDHFRGMQQMEINRLKNDVDKGGEKGVPIKPGKPVFGTNHVISGLEGGKNIYVIRHGTTALNAESGSEDRIRGWTDVPLSEQGHEEAKHTARALADSGIEVIHHSDFQRAADTAKHISNATGAELVATDKLRPWNVGHLTGTSSKSAHPQLVDYATNKPDEKIPDGESFNEFKGRFFQGVQEALDHAGDRKLAIVTHHRGERLLNAWSEMGQPSTNEVHIPTFTEKGEAPGSVQIMHISAQSAPDSEYQAPPEFEPGTSPSDVNATADAQYIPNMESAVNKESFEDMVKSSPASTNIEDRRGGLTILPKTSGGATGRSPDVLETAKDIMQYDGPIGKSLENQIDDETFKPGP